VLVYTAARAEQATPSTIIVKEFLRQSVWVSYPPPADFYDYVTRGFDESNGEWRLSSVEELVESVNTFAQANHLNILNMEGIPMCGERGRFDSIAVRSSGFYVPDLAGYRVYYKKM
ncbi:Hypothetical protein POVR2_LOCUS358, partial [uncultured virus]